MPTLRLTDMRRNPAETIIEEVLGTKTDPGLYRLSANDINDATVERYCGYISRFAAWIARRGAH